ncbi:MAG: sugar phosphate isomerase/epimerase [Burkholderiales bacterium]|nr:sugar phosphate isomerase/epimerase [Burkholderiales bacterium]
MDRKLKLAVCAFRGVALADFLAFVKSNGVGHVEIATHKAGDVDVTATRNALESADVGLAALDAGGHELLRAQTDAEIEAALAHVRSSIRIARDLRCGIVVARLGHRPRLDTLTAIRQARDLLVRCLDDAKARDVTIVVENRFDWRSEDPTQSAVERRAESLVALMEAVGSEHLGIHYDPANFHIAGLEGYPMPWEMMKPWIRYVHLKDCRRYTPLLQGSREHFRLRTDSANGSFQSVPNGAGALNSAAILAALRDAGYDGFVSLEPHELPHKDRWLIEESLRYIRSTGVA